METTDSRKAVIEFWTLVSTMQRDNVRPRNNWGMEILGTANSELAPSCFVFLVSFCSPHSRQRRGEKEGDCVCVS
jgi:hypothetical protein